MFLKTASRCKVLFSKTASRCKVLVRKTYSVIIKLIKSDDKPKNKKSIQRDGIKRTSNLTRRCFKRRGRIGRKGVKKNDKIGRKGVEKKDEVEMEDSEKRTGIGRKRFEKTDKVEMVDSGERNGIEKNRCKRKGRFWTMNELGLGIKLWKNEVGMKIKRWTYELGMKIMHAEITFDRENNVWTYKFGMKIMIRSSDPRRHAVINFDRTNNVLYNHGRQKNGSSNKKRTFVKRRSFRKFHRYCRFRRNIKSTFILVYLCISCTRGNTLGNENPKQQAFSDIYESTLKYVSHCPNISEYNQRASSVCDEVCGKNIQDQNCSYHCMRDSTKTRLVEFCAKPKLFFDYCPEFDPVNQTIQKDTNTLCNSSFSERIYNSSNIFFCDPRNCLQINQSNASTTRSTTTQMSKPDIQNTDWLDNQFKQILGIGLILVSVAIGIVSLLYVCRSRMCYRESRTEGVDGIQDPERNEPLLSHV